MSQYDRIIEYMQKYGCISALQAMRDLGCMRLSSRISELKRLGYNIESEYVEGKNRYGEKMHYKIYFLAADDAADDKGVETCGI